MKPTSSVAVTLFVSVLSSGGLACAPKEDVTPLIAISAGAKERMAVMDRFRHHGAPRRLLPRVTVEEVDDADLPPTPEDDAGADAPDEGEEAPDAGP